MTYSIKVEATKVQTRLRLYDETEMVKWYQISNFEVSNYRDGTEWNVVKTSFIELVNASQTFSLLLKCILL